MTKFEALIFKLIMPIHINRVLILLAAIHGCASSPDQQQQQQHAVASNETRELASNELLLRGGTSSGPGESVASNANLSIAYLTSKDLMDSKRNDQQVQSTSVSAQRQNQNNHHNHNHNYNHPNYHHQNHQIYPNHRNYPSSDQFSSASLTSSGPGQHSAALSPQSGNTLHSIFSSHQLDSLLNRDHHQSPSISNQAFAEFGGVSDSFGSSFGDTLAASTLLAAASTATRPNSSSYSYNLQPSSTSLNAGLIQNLTASLFPVKQLSNATLLSLSELLNKTRQLAQTQSSLLPSSAHLLNELRPPNYSFDPLSLPSPLAGASSAGLQQTLASNNYIPTDSSGSLDQYSSIFDHLSPNQFGFRDPSSNSIVQQQQRFYPKPTTSTAFYHPASILFKGTTNSFKLNSGQSNANQFYAIDNNNNNAASPGVYQSGNTGNPQLGFKPTTSNIYNTYLPFKDKMNSLPTMTNGQALNLAVFHDNYLENPTNGYKFPISSGDSKFASPSYINSPSWANNAGSYNHEGSTSPQYIQHHAGDNRNHIDKIVYHSTPFRPSIVSPPNRLSASTSPNNTNSLSSKGSGNFESGKPSSFGSISSSTVSNSKAEYTTNGQAANPGRFNPKDLAGSGQRQQVGGGGNRFMGDKYSNFNMTPSSSNEDYDYDRLKGGGNSGSDVPSFGGNSTSQSSSDEMRNTTLVNSTGLSSLVPDQSLLDLYEREIDKQIREALYSDPQAGFDSTAAASINPLSTSNWFDRSPTLYLDPSINQQTFASWAQPLHLSSSGSSSVYPLASGSHSLKTRLPPVLTAPASQVSDSLSAALQELPTFSSSDLQPIYPAGPTYSLLSSANQDTLAESSLASHLLPSQSHTTSLDLPLTSSVSGKNYVHSSGNQQQHSTTPSPPSYGLPAILFKLHSSPFSSILSSPLTHLYASLPRNRQNKKAVRHKHPPNGGSQLSQQPQPSPTSQFTHYIQPSYSGSNFAPHQLLALEGLNGIGGSIGGGSNKLGLLNLVGPQMHSTQEISSLASGSGKDRQQQRQRQQAALAAAAAANLLASSTTDEQTLGQLQLALLQAQAAGMMSSGTQQHPVELNGVSTQTPTSAYDNGVSPMGFGLAGGGISPLIWRAILSPAKWARIQSIATSSGQNNQQTLQQTSGSHSSSPIAKLPSLSSWFGGIASHHLLPTTSASSPSIQQIAAKKPSKFRIKILKIPVAFYDQPTTGAVSLLPAHLQPGITASLLAGVLGPQGRHPTGAQSEHSLMDHQLTASLAALQQQEPQDTPTPLSAAAVSSSSLPTPTQSGFQEEPSRSINGFTDINQPNDLQVSPTSL